MSRNATMRRERPFGVHHFRARFGNKRAAVFAQQQKLVDILAARLKALDGDGTGFRRNQFEDIPANHLVPLIAEYFEHLLIHVHDAAVFDNDDAFKGGLGEFAVTFLAFAQLDRSPVALGQDDGGE